jgi:thimet oligopeptidase
MSLHPLVLPSTPDAWLPWIADRCDGLLADARQGVEEIKTMSGRPAMDVLRAFDEVSGALRNASSIASLVAESHPDKDVRERAEKGQIDASALDTDIRQDRALYEVLASLDANGLDATAQRVLEKTLLEFRRAGVDRDDATRARAKEIFDRLTDLGQTFSRNIRDDDRTVKVRPEQLDGLPQDYIDAHPAGDDGLVTITMQYPDAVPFTTFVHDREARMALVMEYGNRAWPQNDPVLVEMLQLRKELAQLLGYADWASYDAEVKMIGNGPAIKTFIDQIRDAAAPSAERDYAILLERARKDHPELEALTSGDRAYYLNLLNKELYDVDAQEVRTYFDFTKARDGVLDVTSRLFGIKYTAVPDAPKWHEDVTVYDVHLDGEYLGRIFLDLHPREGKFSHAAAFDITAGLNGKQLAEGALLCNFSRGLMTHSEVVTLFHEFGHLVHHILAGRHDWVRIAGITTEWDFVEAPSQMLEEWAWDPKVLQSFATNESGEPIPADLVKQMRAAEEFGKGALARVQMFYAAVSYMMHERVPSDPTEIVTEAQNLYDVFSYVPGTHMHAAFGHLEGYTSAYYTYMWSLVIAKDMFSAFNESDLFDPAIAHRYRDRVLTAGGSKDAGELVADFLGRPYGFDAFAAWLDRV